MRNLKRALSLGMTAAMISSLMVVGSSAASYKDVTSEENQEAIEVLKEVGIMVGDDNGNFNPDSKVTRNEMAVVVSNLMAYNVATYKGTSPFTDVPSWAEPYVAACYTNGNIAGYSATVYGGSDNVTTAQAALMLMKALGYFQYESDFDGDWQLATTKQGNKIDLFDDVDSGVREAITRNDLAQLVLNTLKSGTVEADDDITRVTTGDVSVVTGKVSYNYITSAKDYAKAIDDKTPQNSGTSTSSGDYIVELGEKLYDGDLKLKDTDDDFGAPASRWTYKNSEIGTYADSADYVFTGKVKSQEMYDAVGKTAARDYSWDVTVDGGTKTTVFTQADVYDNDKDDLDGTARGTYTYVYLDDEAHGSYSGTATVVIKNTYVAEVTKVKDETITLDDMDDSGLEFDVEGYDEDDVVLYTKTTNGNGDWTVQEILGKAELVEGEATTVREEDRVEVDGTTYKYSNKFNSDNGGMLTTDSVDENVAFYLDQQGNIIRMEDASESNDYAYVYSIGDSSNKYGDDADYGAKLILSDGTILKIDIDSDTTDNYTKSSNTAAQNLTAVETALEGKVVSYSEESDGSYSLTVKTSKSGSFTGSVKEIVKNDTSRVNTGSGYIYTDKNTAFVINEASDDNDDFNAYVGYANAPDVDAGNGTQVLAYVNSKGIAKVVFVIDAESTGSSDDVIFVVGNQKAKVNGTGSNKYYVYDAIVDGEATSIKVKQSSTAYTLTKAIGTDEVGIFFGITENSDGYVTSLKSTVPTDTEVNGKTSKWTAYTGVQKESSGGNIGFGYDAKTKTYTNYYAANDKTVIAYYDDDDLTVESSVKTDTNDQAYVVTDDGEVVAIYVHEIKDGSTTPDTPTADTTNAVKVDGGTVTYTVKKGNSDPTMTEIRNDVLAKVGATWNSNRDSIKQNSDGTYTLTVGGDIYTIKVDNTANKAYSVMVTANSYDVAQSATSAKAGDKVTVTLTQKTAAELTAAPTVTGVDDASVVLTTEGSAAKSVTTYSKASVNSVNFSNLKSELYYESSTGNYTKLADAATYDQNLTYYTASTGTQDGVKGVVTITFTMPSKDVTISLSK